jgi:hypothetical protein
MMKRYFSRGRRGQAMVEYTMVSHVLLIGGVAMAWPFMTAMMNAMTLYYQSIYFIVGSSVP